MYLGDGRRVLLLDLERFFCCLNVISIVNYMLGIGKFKFELFLFKDNFDDKDFVLLLF